MPMCNHCGVIIESLGLCPKCFDELNPSRTDAILEEPQNTSDLKLWFDLLSPYFIPTCFVFLGMSLIFTLNYLGIGKEITSLKIDGGFFKITNEDDSKFIKYSMGESKKIDGYVHSAHVQNGSISEGGVILQLHYLNPKSYQDFKVKFEGSKECSGSFYNSNMRHAMILARDKACSNNITERSFSKWEKLSISGRILKFTDGMSGGKAVMMPGGDFDYFLLDSCSQIMGVTQ